MEKTEKRKPSARKILSITGSVVLSTIIVVLVFMAAVLALSLIHI